MRVHPPTNLRKYVSLYAAARRLDIDPRTLIRLAERQIVKPDARAGDRLLFADDRIDSIRTTVNAHLGRNTP